MRGCEVARPDSFGRIAPMFVQHRAASGSSCLFCGQWRTIGVWPILTSDLAFELVAVIL